MKTKKETVLSIKCELHSSLHVLCPHLLSALRAGCTQKCTESTSIMYCILCFQNTYMLLKIKLHAISASSDYFIFLLPIFKKIPDMKNAIQTENSFLILMIQGFPMVLSVPVNLNIATLPYVVSELCPSSCIQK